MFDTFLVMNSQFPSYVHSGYLSVFLIIFMISLWDQKRETISQIFFIREEFFSILSRIYEENNTYILHSIVAF